jgi:hypothetical protein
MKVLALWAFHWVVRAVESRDFSNALGLRRATGLGGVDERTLLNRCSFLLFLGGLGGCYAPIPIYTDTRHISDDELSNGFLWYGIRFQDDAVPPEESPYMARSLERAIKARHLSFEEIERLFQKHGGYCMEYSYSLREDRTCFVTYEWKVRKHRASGRDLQYSVRRCFRYSLRGVESQRIRVDVEMTCNEVRNNG